MQMETALMRITRAQTASAEPADGHKDWPIDVLCRARGSSWPGAEMRRGSVHSMGESGLQCAAFEAEGEEIGRILLTIGLPGFVFSSPIRKKLLDGVSKMFAQEN
jgi:hypothetical protein